MERPVVEGYTGQDKKAYCDDPWPMLYAALGKGEILQAMVTGVEHTGSDDKQVQLVISFGSVKGIVPPEEAGENLNTKTSTIGQHIAVKVKACDRAAGVVYLSRKAAIADMGEKTWNYLDTVCGEIIALHQNEIAPAKQKLAALADQRGPEAKELKALVRQVYNRAAELSPTLTAVARLVTAKGAYVDIGGMLAFMPVTEATWSIQKHCRAVLRPGEALDVKVLDIDPTNRQVLVSRKALIPDPWETVEQKYQVGGIYFGVVRMVGADYVLIELEPGIVGLAFRAAMEEIPEGAQVVTKLLRFDVSKRRLQLNLTRVLERGA